jgi:hypothetical protein
MNTTPTLIDTTIAAQDAPLGVLLWPVANEHYAPNYTLESVDVVRNTAGTHALVALRTARPALFSTTRSSAGGGRLTACRRQHRLPDQTTASHHADEAATRPTSVARAASAPRRPTSGYCYPHTGTGFAKGNRTPRPG